VEKSPLFFTREGKRGSKGRFFLASPGGYAHHEEEKPARHSSRGGAATDTSQSDRSKDGTCLPKEKKKPVVTRIIGGVGSGICDDDRLKTEGKRKRAMPSAEGEKG